MKYNPWRGWEISLRSQAKGGKANEELIEFIAQKLGCGMSDIEIIAGHKSRRKRVFMPDNNLFRKK